MTLKIMHTGDIHLGMKFNQYPKISSQLENARYQALKNVVKTANIKNANLLVVAGDLFDKTNIKNSEVKRTIDILDGFAGDLVLILPGNHDYSDGINKLWDKFRKEITGKIIILDQKKVYKLHDFQIPAAIYPAPCETKLSAENNLNWIKNLNNKIKADYHIAVAHGALAGFSPDLNDNYFKMSVDELLAIEMDLWLLGHSHLPYPNQKKVVNQKIFNNGTPEPDGMDCSHPGYAWYLEIEENKEIKAELIETGNFHFSDIKIKINSTADLEKAVNKILESEPEKKILRLKIEGEISKNDFEIKENYLRKIRDNCFYFKIDQSNLNIKIDQNLIKDEFSEGSFPYKLLNDLKSNPEAVSLAFKMLKEVQD